MGRLGLTLHQARGSFHFHHDAGTHQFRLWSRGLPTCQPSANPPAKQAPHPDCRCVAVPQLPELSYFNPRAGPTRHSTSRRKARALKAAGTSERVQGDRRARTQSVSVAGEKEGGWRGKARGGQTKWDRIKKGSAISCACMQGDRCSHSLLTGCWRGACRGPAGGRWLRRLCNGVRQREGPGRGGGVLISLEQTRH